MASSLRKNVKSDSAQGKATYTVPSEFTGLEMSIDMRYRIFKLRIIKPNAVKYIYKDT